MGCICVRDLYDGSDSDDQLRRQLAAVRYPSLKPLTENLMYADRLLRSAQRDTIPTPTHDS